MQTIIIILAGALASAVLVLCALGCLALAAQGLRVAISERWIGRLLWHYRVEAWLTVLFVLTLCLTAVLCILGALWASGLLCGVPL